MYKEDSKTTRLIERIFVKTKVGELNWSRSAEPRKFQARVGDFVVFVAAEQFSNSLTGTNSKYVLIVNRLDGSQVDVLSDNMSPSVTRQVPISHWGTIQQIYELVSDEKDDIEELIRSLS